jgi:glycosyltransferase involved in cell wall biosynthesis
VFGVLTARWIGIPAIASQLCYRNLLSFKERVLLSVVDRFATAVFVNCDAVAQDLSSNWHLSRKNIHVCHNGFEPTEFHPNDRKRPASLCGASIIVGTVAVFREEKNLPLLIDAFAALHQMDRGARLLLVGSGPMKESLQERALARGIADACIFQEATAYPAEWMRAMDVFVLPSNSEAFSNALLEAMACGCCPVGSRVGGTSELISHGERGLLFESGNVQELAKALCILASDPVRRQQMASAATRFAHENLTIDVAASRVASVYRELLQKHDALLGKPAISWRADSESA